MGFTTLILSILSHGFICSKVDTSMFIYLHQSIILMLLLYVDDMQLIGNIPTLILSFITALSTNVAMKDFGDLYYFLEVKVVHTSSSLFLS